MINLIHIPKTGGTAIRHSLRGSGCKNIKYPNTHAFSLFSKNNQNIGFIVRDPWERFCSGFWDFKTTLQRIPLAKNAENLPYVIPHKPQQMTEEENFILANIADPNSFVEWLIEKDGNVDLYSRELNLHSDLGMMTCSLYYWLGDLEKYKSAESNVNVAIDITALSSYMSNHHEVTMVSNPFGARSRKQFNIEQPYTATESNLNWFKEWRKDDYLLVDYIKTKEYYYEESYAF